MVQGYSSNQIASNKKKTKLLHKSLQKSYSPSALALSNETYTAMYGVSVFAILDWSSDSIRVEKRDSPRSIASAVKELCVDFIQPPNF